MWWSASRSLECGFAQNHRMPPSPDHVCQVFSSPWPGVFGTVIESGHHYGRHWHATYGIGVMEHGAQTSASGRGMVDSFAGDVITTNPGEVHDGRPLGGPSRRWRMLYLEADALDAFADDMARDTRMTRPVIRDLELRRCLSALFVQLAARPNDDAGRLATEESLVRALGLVLERHATISPARPVAADVSQVRERLADDPLHAPSLTEMSTMVGLSKYQLLRRFEKAYGVPPHAWLVQQRVEKARALIRRGETLADAAASTGFADQSHMTRWFVRQFGFTPGAWQQATAARGPQ
jgi:AraC-like DNA-binding protein